MATTNSTFNLVFVLLFGYFIDSVLGVNFNASDIEQYTVQCGDSWCRGIYEYCYHEEKCKTCNDAACLPTIPGQCQIYCKYIHNVAEDNWHTDDGCSNVKQKSHPDINTKWMAGFGAAVSVAVVLGILCIVLMCKLRKRKETGQEKSAETMKMITSPENNHKNCDDRNDRACLAVG